MLKKPGCAIVFSLGLAFEMKTCFRFGLDSILKFAQEFSWAYRVSPKNQIIKIELVHPSDLSHLVQGVTRSQKVTPSCLPSTRTGYH